MQSDSLASLKRVIVTHLSPKKANSIASPHTGYPLTSQKNDQFICITKYLCILLITHSNLTLTSSPFWVVCWCCVTFLYLSSFIVIHHVPCHRKNLYGYWGWVQKNGILGSLRYMYSNCLYLNYINPNPLRFPIFYLGLPNFSFSEKLRGSIGKIFLQRSNINQTEYRIVT